MVTYRIVAYLFGLALGYWVLTLAAKEKGSNQKLGKVLGWIIIVVSLCGPLCLAGSALFCRSHWDACRYSAECPWNGPGHCPWMGTKPQMPAEKGGASVPAK